MHAVVLIDQAPIRASIASDCMEAMSRLEGARVGWHHFERKDKPAFARWRAREFGALLVRRGRLRPRSEMHRRSSVKSRSRCVAHFKILILLINASWHGGATQPRP